MNVFELRDRLIADYATYVNSFIAIQDERIRDEVDDSLDRGLLWPEPRIGLNPAFAPGAWIDELVDEGVLHEECRKVFRAQKVAASSLGDPLRLHKHQVDAIHAARTGGNYVLTTGTGSGKSLAYLVPIVEHVLRAGSGGGIKAIVVYPMNALANSQHGELEKFLCHGYPDGKGPVTFARYTGQETDQEKNVIIASPPDILLTNYVMLELLLTRVREKGLVRAAKGLRFLVFDELHTYRGRQGEDVALLSRRVREACEASALQCVGTSATMGGAGSFEEQRVDVARVASLLFGAPVETANVIGETLQRATRTADLTDPTFVSALRARVADTTFTPPGDYQAFVSDPLSSWIESTFGIKEEPGSGRLVRAVPRTISGPDGAARELAVLTGVDEGQCVAGIQQQLLAGYAIRHPETKFPAFAFRLHQFISRGETVYASVEAESVRHITLQSQKYVPGDRGRVLLPLVFCRECGQEYYCVRTTTVDGNAVLVPRRLDDREEEEGSVPGYLYLSESEPWPSDPAEVVDRLPDDWVEEQQGAIRVRPARRKDLPRQRWVSLDGHLDGGGALSHFIPAPFRFCVSCGVSYGARQRSDFAKLTTLGSEGRSTATTILSLSAIRSLRRDETLRPEARKLLSFTDNRQDASLQAGHFNDFLEIGLLRSALYRAVLAAGGAGITHEVLTQRVFEALDLPIELYAADPGVRFQALTETQRALRDVLGYRLYLDLRRGWRITSPNLEQCALLEITYESLEEVCAAEDVWAQSHPALAGAAPSSRAAVAKTLLDYMRRELAIKVNYLSGSFQESLIQLSSQRLGPPWALDENERLERASVLFPRSSRADDWGGWLYLSPRGGFGQYLRRTATFPEHHDTLKLTDTATISRELLEGLRVAGLVEIVAEPKTSDDVPGYQPCRLRARSRRYRGGSGWPREPGAPRRRQLRRRGDR